MNRRLFVAIDLPESLKAKLGHLCSGLPDARWSDVYQMHITLQFIGDSKHEQFLDIQERLQAIRVPSFSLRLSGLGYFPQAGQEQVLWAGLDPELEPEGLKTLKRAVDQALGSLQLKKTKFVPHVTLARLAQTPLDAVEAYLKQHGDFQSEVFEVSEFHLFSSRLSAAGAIHTLERSYPLIPQAHTRLEQRMLEFRNMQFKADDRDE